MCVEMTFKEDACETALFIKNMDGLFDGFNVPSYSQGKKKRKPFQDSYTKSTSKSHLNVSKFVYRSNIKLEFLNEILQYLND